MIIDLICLLKGKCIRIQISSIDPKTFITYAPYTYTKNIRQGTNSKNKYRMIQHNKVFQIKCKNRIKFIMHCKL